MPTYTVVLDFSNLLTVAEQIERRVMEKLRASIGSTAEKIKNQWVDAVMEAPGIWINDRKAYAGSIRWRYTTQTSAVVETTLALADEIEDGRPARDLKRMLHTSTKVRQGQKGRYLVIPFRHNTPGNGALAPAMPKAIYKAARKLAPSTETGTGERLSGTGAYDIKTKKYLTVAQKKYAWGARLPAGMMPRLKPSHTTDRYAGMVRFDTTGGGKAKDSTYLTFRTMSEHSAGWIIPAKPGLHIARDIARNVGKVLEDELGAD